MLRVSSLEFYRSGLNYADRASLNPIDPKRYQPNKAGALEHVMLLSPEERSPPRTLPIVATIIVVPFVGLTNYIFRILYGSPGSPKKELQWTAKVHVNLIYGLLSRHGFLGYRLP